jgi:mono/diheme cytochrome c family protein
MKTNLVLLVAFLAASGGNLAVRYNPATPNREFLPEMVRTAAYGSFSANPNFSDGKTLQQPVPGTVPRPEPARAATAERGQAVFATFCRPCHGPAGKGDGMVAQRGFPPPPSLAAAQAQKLSDDEIFRIVSQGRKNMPAHAAQIAETDRRAVIAWVRTLGGTLP